MRYVDGFLLAVPKRKLPLYRRIAQRAGRVWREHGALEYRECVGDDLKVKSGALERSNVDLTEEFSEHSRATSGAIDTPAAFGCCAAPSTS